MDHQGMELLLSCWFFCTACANGLWLVIFKSPLVKHIASHFTDADMCTSADLENYFLARRWWFVHNLWTCTTCQAVWTSAVATLAFYTAVPVSLLFSPIIFLATLPFVKWTQKHL